MTKIIEIPVSETHVQYHFICLGCDQYHAFDERTWTWNRDFNKPTLTPSYLITGHRWNEEKQDYTKPFICHSFIKDGYIQYLGDCTHDLKGETVKIPEYDSV